MVVRKGYAGTLAERMERKRTVDPETGCWNWHGSKDTKGYGQMRVDGKARIATHIALELAGHPRQPEKPCALHKCDNPGCVNPDHLWWGTMRENTRDMMSKGRAGHEGLELGRRPSGGKVDVECAFCGRGFQTRRTQFLKNKRNFCGKACCAKWQSVNFTGARRGETNGIDPRIDKSDPLWGEA